MTEMELVTDELLERPLSVEWNADHEASLESRGVGDQVEDSHDQIRSLDNEKPGWDGRTQFVAGRSPGGMRSRRLGLIHVLGRFKEAQTRCKTTMQAWRSHRKRSST